MGQHTATTHLWRLLLRTSVSGTLELGFPGIGGVVRVERDVVEYMKISQQPTILEAGQQSAGSIALEEALQHQGFAVIRTDHIDLDPRLKACLMMDAAMTADVVAAGLAQPSMWITRDAGTIRLERRRSGGWTEADIHQTLTTMRAVYDMNRTGDAYYVQIPGMFHVNFTDTPSFSPLAARIGMTGPIDAGRGHDIVNAYTVAFFDRHLKGSAVTLLDGPSRAYPDAIFETTHAKAVP